MNNIVISLTTIPNRLLEPKDYMGTRLGLQTLLEQKYSNYSVHFNIPHIYKKTGETLYIPQWLEDFQQKYSNLYIYRTEDYGSITKILPTLERISDPETIIIVADDDLYYMNEMIDGHIKARIKYPNAAIGYAGISSINGHCHFCTTVERDTRVKILEGYKTVSYLRKFFDIDELKNNFLGKSWRDDETLSAYMGYKHIEKIVVAYDGDKDFTPRVESFPVIGHTPVERGGCVLDRESDNTRSELNIQDWYKLGYLER